MAELLTQKQMAELFDKDRRTITRHIQNIYRDGELEENSVCSFFEHTAEDGKNYKVQYYNLDMIISVGYRVNSKRGIMFRKWATAILKEYIKIESEFLKEENKVIWEKRNIKSIYKKYIKWYNFIKYKKRRYIEID